MKKVTILLAALALTASVKAQNWKLDRTHSRLGFTITHMMVSDVDGMFKEFDAAIQSTKPDFSDAIITMAAKTSSIFTDNEQRDQHLRAPDYFDAEKYPTLTFRSNSIKKNGNNKYKLTGDLTMHGITKPVTMELVFKGQAEHPMTKKQIAGFRLTGTIKRSDFKIAEGTSTAALGDEVQIIANGEFTQG